ncbi:MAG: Mpo1-like protein [Bacteroidota bacterium]
MSKLLDLLDNYGKDHQTLTNKIMHWIAIPAIFYSTIGFLWFIPVPEQFKSFSFPINWATIVLVIVFIYYSQLSRSLSWGMVFIISTIIGSQYKLESIYGSSLLMQIYLVIFVIAWFFQFIGHMIEGNKPSFFNDVRYILIGPLWLLSLLYKNFGIRF